MVRGTVGLFALVALQMVSAQASKFLFVCIENLCHNFNARLVFFAIIKQRCTVQQTLLQALSTRMQILVLQYYFICC